MRLLIFLLLVFLVVLAVGLTFTVGNITEVSLNYYLDSQAMPLVEIILLAFGSGVLLTVVASLLVIVPLWLRLTRLHSQLKRQSLELTDLREQLDPSSSAA